jgi:hypothetical protein
MRQNDLSGTLGMGLTKAIPTHCPVTVTGSTVLATPRL